MVMASARKASVNIKFTRAAKNGSKSHSISEMAEHTGGFSFTEAATDEIDSISIHLSDKNFKWINGWMPKKGDKLEAVIVSQNWSTGKQEKLNCGKFCLDDISASGPDFSCEIRGTSVPELGAIRSVKRTCTWKKALFDGIAKKIAKRYHLKLRRKNVVKVGNTVERKAGKTRYRVRTTIKQSGEDDLSFFTGLCRKYGMGVKVTSGAIVLYNKTDHESKNPSLTIHRRDMLDWKYNNTLSGTYTGVRYKFKNKIRGGARSGKLGKGSRILVIKESFDNPDEAIMNACETVNSENEQGITMSVTIPGNTKVRAGNTIKIDGLYQLGGKYFVDKAVHTIEADSGYTTALELHKCVKRIRASVAQLKKGEGRAPDGSNPNKGAEIRR